MQLDPLFLETVTIDADHPMIVFLQEEAESNGLIVAPGTTSFEVKEKANGSSNATFAYPIMAKRRFYQDYRFGNDPTIGKKVDWTQYHDMPTIPRNYREAYEFLGMDKLANKHTKQEAAPVTIAIDKTEISSLPSTSGASKKEGGSKTASAKIVSATMVKIGGGQ